MPSSTSPLTSAHRGFVYALHRKEADTKQVRFAFSIAHRGLRLHTSEAEYRSPAAADRAARQFVNDALGAYDYATHALAA
ncbi:MAG: hypothetical protein AAF170_17015 [Bacteroidota bacterium]